MVHTSLFTSTSFLHIIDFLMGGMVINPEKNFSLCGIREIASEKVHIHRSPKQNLRARQKKIYFYS
jgi:hypothetical protein